MLRKIIAGVFFCAFAGAFAPLAHPADIPTASPRIAPKVKAAPAPMRDLGTPMSAREPVDKTGAPAAPKGANCGTFWTGWMEDPDTNANPCPKDCVRGERQLVNTHKQGDAMLYAARFQCYRMAAVPQPRAEPPATPGKPAPAPSRVITTPKIEISGLAPRVIRTETIRISGVLPKVITTARIQISGPAPRVIRTETIRISGVLPKVIVTPRIEITGIR